jgi:phosphonate transport system substrate-binding protein
VKFLSYMSPTIPEDFYRDLGRQIQKRSGFPIEVWFECCRSGPSLQELTSGRDPFSCGKADIALLCAPTYIRARERGVTELLGYTPIFKDDRNRGEAVYYSDVMVPPESGVNHFDELRGGSWAYNDTESLSGYFSMLHFLREKGETADFFTQAICSGGHRDSLQLLEKGEVDCAAIDGDLLLFLSQEKIPVRARKIGEIGPFPAPPLGLCCKIPEEQKMALRAAFKELREDVEAMKRFRKTHLLEDLVPVTDEHYRPVSELLKGLGQSR